MNRRRLDAEAIRDSLLAVAGRLDAQSGRNVVRGPGRPAPDACTFSRCAPGPGSTDFGRLFDRADPGSIVAGARRVGRGPAGPLLPERPVRERDGPGPGRADRHAKSPDRTEARIRRLYALVLGRPPSPAELELGLQFLAAEGSVDPWERYCQLILCQNEFLYTD